MTARIMMTTSPAAVHPSVIASFFEINGFGLGM